MSSASVSPRLTTRGMRLMLAAAAVLVFLVGIPLNLLPLQTDTFFAWTIGTPLTAAFLGAAYWSSCVLEALAARERVWVNARIAVPAVFLFTLLTLIVTLVHLDRFHLNAPQLITRLGTYIWILVYAVVPIILGVLWFLQERAPGTDPPRKYPAPPWLRLVTIVQAVVMIPVGIALLLVPMSVAPIWPWALTPLTGRAIGAWVFAIGVAAAQAAWENDLRRLFLASLAYMAIGVLELIAVVRFAGDMNWSSPSAWVYIVFLLSFVAVGIGTLLAGRRLDMVDA